MIKGSEHRQVDHPIDQIFVDRWSPRAMTGESITDDDLMILFEAARWAPSAYNNQPWRILYAHRESEHWPLFLDLLVESNRTWARRSSVLLLFLSKNTFDHNGQPSRTHSFDTGAAWENLALQAMKRGLIAHGMQGFNYDKARAVLNVPGEYQVEAMVAIGKPGLKETLPEGLQIREAPNGRKPINQTVCEGPFCW